jgi:hypothetical protein
MKKHYLIDEDEMYVPIAFVETTDKSPWGRELPEEEVKKYMAALNRYDKALTKMWGIIDDVRLTKKE